ncbi:hypothetical protein NADFUDRAFT_78332 [Nadsonia fulvescens var. elongata DSM 6958]|uniref:Monopolin complex subunit Csm1/Pcs1 C-terminal domain-containing protein n=1 Tax=Nadsonia fulvescens var. elongata DSM 6958 TaxID=857566 RepID=A0A1E3PJM0_9ASCO|nr:hypothetical protein NADFUDRAFT_78332 [Nadsonia fulvescens var. elongata DSM 6958]
MPPKKKVSEAGNKVQNNLDSSLVSIDTPVVNVPTNEGASAKNKAKRAKRQIKKSMADKGGVNETSKTKDNIDGKSAKADSNEDDLPPINEDEGNDSIISKPKLQIQNNNNINNNAVKPEPANKRKRSSASVSGSASVAKKSLPNVVSNNNTAKRPMAKPESTIASTNIFTDVNQDFRYERLVELRETKPEALLNDYKLRIQRKMEASDKLIEELSNKVTSLSQSGQEVFDLRQENSDIRGQNIQLVHQAENLLGQLELLRDQLADYEDANTILNAKLQSKSTNRDDYLAGLKQQISSDLSGLVIKDVKLTNGKRIFDCVQSGKNGIFHYELSIYVNDNNEVSQEYTFIPRLDPIKDEDLMKILPDYFSDPLTFSKVELSKFFWKITQSLNQKLYQ